LKARIADLGGTVFALSPADFGEFIADETEKWGKVIRASTSRPGELDPLAAADISISSIRRIHPPDLERANL
jgi:hypothetical protein